MRVNDVMTTDVEVVRPDTSVSEIAKRLLARNISAVPVVDDRNQVVGIVSEGDLMRRADGGTARRPSWWLGLLAGLAPSMHDYVKTHGIYARDVMSGDVVSVEEEASLADVATILEQRRIKRVPVVRDGRLRGIVSRADLLRGLAAAGTDRTASPDDRDIKSSIETAAHDAGVSLLYVNVAVLDGEVSIWGMVDSEAEKTTMRKVAEGVIGVRDVRDNVNVKSERLRATLDL